MALIREIVPAARIVGIPYNPGEANAAVLVKRIEAMAPGLGLKIVTAPAPTTGDVLMATRSLAGKVDAIYVTTDNTVISAFESVLKVAGTRRYRSSRAIPIRSRAVPSPRSVLTITMSDVKPAPLSCACSTAKIPATSRCRAWTRPDCI